MSSVDAVINQIGEIEYLKPNEHSDIGNSVYFKPSDEPQNMDDFKLQLEETNFQKGIKFNTSRRPELPQIDELSNDDEDQELQCMEFEDIGVDEDGNYTKRGTSPTFSPRRSLTDYSPQDSSFFDNDFIDIGSITDDHIELADAKRYFKHRWWLINPDRWPKRYWDNFVALIIVSDGLS